MSLFTLIYSFLKMPLSIKKEIVIFYFKRSFGVKPSDHQTIWTSFLYFSVLHVQQISVDGDSFAVAFNFQGKPVNVVIRGGKSSDIFVFFQVFIADSYRPLIDFVQRKSIVPKVTVDVGANVGYFTLLMSLHYPSELLVAVEPEHKNFSQLRINTSAVRGPNQHLICAAIWSHRKVLSVKTSSGKEWSFQVGESEEDQSCDALALSDIMLQHNISAIDILKLDVEGTEDVLFKDGNFLVALGQVKVLGVEIHDQLADRRMIHHQLEEIAFKFFEVGELTIAWNTKLVHE